MLILQKNVSFSSKPYGQKSVILLFVIFAFFILAFYENMLNFNLYTLIYGMLVLCFIIVFPFVLRKTYKKSCPMLTNTMFLLLALGFTVLQRLEPSLALRQLFFASLGLVASLFIPLILRIFKQFEKLELLYIALCIFLLSMVSLADILGAFFNIPIVTVDQFGATRAIQIAGITVQTSEFVKPIFVIYLSSAFRLKPNAKKLIVVSLLSAVLIGILVLQRDLGKALMFFVIFITMLYAATGNKFLVSLGLLAISGASVIAYQLFAHLRVRVFAWQNPWQDITGMGWQAVQSLFAIGTFGAFGAGLSRGLPDRIPVVERDFIFSAITEEFGWLFAVLLIGAYGLILVRGIDIAKKSKRPLYALMSLGFTIFLVFQAFVTISGNINFIPMTGITLPFVSYGGSSVFISIIMIGVLNWLNGQLNTNEEIQDEEIL